MSVSGLSRIGEEEEEEEIVHMGNAIMSFYSALIDLLGRCAPEMHVSSTGFNKSISYLVYLDDHSLNVMKPGYDFHYRQLLELS